MPVAASSAEMTEPAKSPSRFSIGRLKEEVGRRLQSTCGGEGVVKGVSRNEGVSSLDGRELQIEDCCKSYRVGKQTAAVLQDVNLAIKPGEFFCIVGGSGCGKSTLLKMVAGLEQATTGEVTLGGSPISKPGIDRGVVFQEHRLLPWLTVWQNIDFGLSEATTVGREEIIAEHIALVGLEGFEKAYPSQLSGGMAQRAGLARALVNRPSVLLMDEPLGALDALTRQQMQNEILRVWQAEKTTVILVTHDIDEALFLADRVAVLGGKPGVVRDIINVDLPRPRSRGDAGFDGLRQRIWDTIFQQAPSPLHSTAEAASRCSTP